MKHTKIDTVTPESLNSGAGVGVEIRGCPFMSIQNHQVVQFCIPRTLEKHRLTDHFLRYVKTLPKLLQSLYYFEPEDDHVRWIETVNSILTCTSQYIRGDTAENRENKSAKHC
jgi:hypothetical protein